MNKGCNIIMLIWSFLRTFEIKMNLSIFCRSHQVTHDLGTIHSIRQQLHMSILLVYSLHLSMFFSYI